MVLYLNKTSDCRVKDWSAGEEGRMKNDEVVSSEIGEIEEESSWESLPLVCGREHKII